MKSLTTAALCALLLCCLNSVQGESITEQNLHSIHHNSPLSVAGENDYHLLTHAGDLNVEKRWKRGHSGSLNSSSVIVDDEELEPRIDAGGQPLQSQMDHLGGLSSDQSDNPRVSDLPCPPAVAIAPCVCSSDADYNINLNCTLVESEEQLANVFQQEFPVKELTGFYMSKNSAIRVLDNILNGVTFKTVDFQPGPFALEAISEYFLLGLKDTLSFLRIDDSQLTSSQFPFAILDEMTKIGHFSITYSQITWIPKIELPNVTFMQIRMGYTDVVEFGTFPILAGSYVLGLEVNAIEHVEPGSFYYVDGNSTTSNQHVLIDVSRNSLQRLEAGTLPMRNGVMELKLYDNQISVVAPGAFVMPEATDKLSIILRLYLNLLTTIDEDVYGDLWPFLSLVQLYGNPLTCGCDMAWLVTNPDYMAKVDPDATCADGTILHNLDPAGYSSLC